MTLPVADWVDKGAVQARTKLLPQLPEEARPTAEKAIARVVEGKGAISTLTNHAFVNITHLIDSGQSEEARRAWTRDRATFAERQAILVGGARASYASYEEEEEAWTEVKEIAMDVLKFTGPLAIQLLLAMA